MKRLYTDAFVFSFGYGAYSLIELAWRRYTHFTMGLAGGLCFLILYRLYKKCKNLSIFKRCLLGSFVITLVEYFFGLIVNKKLKLDVWDYSDMPLNISGQVCLLYSFLWGLLCLLIFPIAGKISKIEDKL